MDIDRDFLALELNWLEEVIAERLTDKPISLDSYVKDLSSGKSYYTKLAMSYGYQERLILILALAPYIRPTALNLLQSEENSGKNIGGIKYSSFSSSVFIPTVETALFLLQKEEHPENTTAMKTFVSSRLSGLEYFHADAILLRSNILDLQRPDENLPYTSTSLRLVENVLHQILWNKPYVPAMSSSFPAEKITTEQEWSDMVVNRKTENQLNEILSWVKQRNAMKSIPAVARKVLPGYRTLFYGPSGTGKTLAATLIGKLTGLEVYRIDLSKLVSKYIGETEKNLKQVFDIAEQHDWILFFDEGDAIFGKRSETSSSNDRYANQEVSYLLQRVERFPGTVIVATNFKTNLDKAFLRRFQTIVHFPAPNEDTRKMLWEKVFNDEVPKENDFDFSFFAKNFELTGANIINVLQQAVVLGFEENGGTIGKPQLTRALTRELSKLDKLDMKTERKLIFEHEECC
ncbi:ATP-binding protein [Aureibacter tunicatorum]|uniref:DNA polymerase III delta prime subunit n=1 Tax=Aureibacter tunicatorum TaxID=866807 RepID=A0AAE3XK84_9BACT|nr:ATP-binding protein [Aureibacter tunicatorum]MDR6237450.1 DNA polymerase III delta prime subunit [Aureibacter tunicatorum]BDD06440.1 hypothetical protein AUTU_39230 [Aureibacter tunicatorum]